MDKNTPSLKLVYKGTLKDQLKIYIRKKALKFETRAHKTAPQIACFPREAIGKEIIILGYYEHRLLEAIFQGALTNYKEKFKSQTILDIGANIGNHTCFFAQRFAHVIAFEPNPLPRHLLSANIMANRFKNVSVEPIGLGEKEEVLTFYPHANSNMGMGSFVHAQQPNNQASLGQELDLQVCRGDNVLEKKYPSHKIGCIKLDIEGFEYFALRGLKETLRKHQPFVLFESHKTAGDAQGAAILEFLKECGYKAFYTLKQPKTSKSKIIKTLKRLKPKKIYLQKTEVLEEKTYPLILASCENLY